MKKSTFFLLAICICVAASIIIPSCKKTGDDIKYKPDKSKLSALIDSVNQLYNKAIEGTKPGFYEAGAKTTLKTSLDLAVQVNTGDHYIQQEVENSISNLNKALQLFSSGFIQEVSAGTLVARWKLDGNANDASGNDHSGMFKTGWVGSSSATATDGATLPLPVTDRFNRPGLAYEFNNAAHIEVPYHASLNPKAFTISMWIKSYSTRDNNYLISLNRWNGYKLHVQKNTFLHMSFKADNGYQDMESNPGGIRENVWTFIAISYSSGTMKFYVDNSLVKTAQVSGTPVTTSPVNLSIGNELPKSVYKISEPNGPYGFSSGHFFTGALDDIRIYRNALKDADVLAIYNFEKTLL
jgi:hypothetical protein